MTDAHVGWIINTHYDTINMLTRMQDKNPHRFEAFSYSQTDIYAMIDRLQHQQHIYD